MQGRVISGHKAALEMAMAEATKKGALKAVPLAVSGAFHTKLMQPARDALLQVRERAVPAHTLDCTTCCCHLWH